MRFLTVLGVIACCCVAMPAGAQAGFSNVDVKGLPTIYVTDRAGHEVKGKLVSLTDAAIGVRLEDMTLRTFNQDEVSLVEKRGDSLKNGTLIGLGVGIVLSGIAVADCPHCGGARVPIILAGIGIYTAIGTAIDAAIPGRTRIWPLKSSKARGGVTLAISPQQRSAALGWSIR